MSGAHETAQSEGVEGLHKEDVELPAPDIAERDSMGAGSLRVRFICSYFTFSSSILRLLMKEKSTMEWERDEGNMALDDLETDFEQQVDSDGDS
jgi:hypothetical protein